MKIDNLFFAKASFFLAIIYCLDPTGRGWGTDNIFILKFSPVLFLFVFFCANALKNIELQNRKAVKKYQIPYYIITFVMLFGSLLAYFEYGQVSSSFLSRGLLIALVCVSFFHLPFNQLDDLVSFLGRLSFYSLFFISSMVVLSKLNVNGFSNFKNIYHEEVSIIFFAGLFAFLSKSNTIKVLGVLLAIVALGLSGKNTGYLTLMILLVYVFLAVLMYTKKQQKLFVTYIIGALLIFMAGAAFIVVYFYSQYLPSGSPGVRLVTYNERFNQFLSSPFVGEFFTLNMLFELPTKKGSIVVPSHSDLLDIVAAGGIVTIYYFIAKPVLLSIWMSIKCVIEKRGDKNILLVSGLFLSSFIALSFNPIINQPRLAIFLWFSLIYVLRRNKSYENSSLRDA
ncbi:hypothetical protein [Halomonas stenophila]|uniref:O-antigen ligase domain-containing protein n=1 Tax=Halomonas stenophila TaxID=795312 RepID=A0A7W5HK93_9GAMM|nr:hypothetical protein [Halomonas stenophila]MBB3229753.1 hypothetical protein [Halomonas stenophila]